jgi:hypothetical protein
MSNFGEENGEVKLPVKEWKKFRDTIYNNYNQKLKEVYETALEVHKQMMAKKKGKRNVNLHSLFNEVIENHRLVRATRDYEGWHFRDMVQSSLINNGKMVKPKKKDFAPKKASQGETLYDDELSVRFDNKNKTVHYSTSDNNHSVDRGRESFLGSMVFRQLDRVTFTSKTGGYFKASSEYNEDEFGNGGQSRVSSTYGKYKKNKKLARSLYGF